MHRFASFFYKIFASIGALGLLILVSIGPVVSEIYAILYNSFSHDNSCKYVYFDVNIYLSNIFVFIATY
jgi:hypothetical protein